MAKKNNNNLFWLSYSDLMTSLFFVMLVLFIVTVVRMGSTLKTVEDDKKKVEAEREQLMKILQLGEQFEGLSQSGTLRYVPERQTFVAKDFEGIEIFEPNKWVIKNEFLPTVDKVGQDLGVLLEQLHKANPQFSYQLVIEGNMANKWDHSISEDSSDGYEKSFKRALALYNRWRLKGVDLRKYNTEILICGSGFNGINRDNEVEENNKRFVIQIIPKIDRVNKAGN